MAAPLAATARWCLPVSQRTGASATPRHPRTQAQRSAGGPSSPSSPISSPASSSPAAAVALRPATASDLERTRRAVLREAINPLGLDAARTLVACEDASSSSPGAWIGSGQLSRLQRAPWQQQRQQHQQQGRGPSTPAAYELRSLVVAPTRRGRGVGSALVRALLDMARREAAAAAGGGADVFLTTTRARAPFYRREGGFEECPLSEAPPLLAAEVAVGTLVAAVVAWQRLVVMKRRVET